MPNVVNYCNTFSSLSWFNLVSSSLDTLCLLLYLSSSPFNLPCKVWKIIYSYHFLNYTFSNWICFLEKIILVLDLHQKFQLIMLFILQVSNASICLLHVMWIKYNFIYYGTKCCVNPYINWRATLILQVIKYKVNDRII